MSALFALSLLTFGIAGLTLTRATDLIEPDLDGVSYGGGVVARRSWRTGGTLRL
jgi:hypothetical protein